MLQRTLFIILNVMLMMLLAGCGKSVNKRNLGPDEYFEYAKDKFDRGKYLDASTEFSVVVLRFSGNPVVDDAQYYLAESHFKQKEYLIAVSEYQKVISDYPQSAYAPIAQFKIGYSYYKMSFRPALDQDYTKKAIRQFQNYIDENPQHELVQNAKDLQLEMREKLAEKKIIGADTYRKMGIHDSAVIYYDIIINEYYDTSWVPQAMFYKGVGLLKQNKLVEAQTAFTLFLEKYPDHRYAKRVERQVNKITEELKDSQPDHTELNDQP